LFKAEHLADVDALAQNEEFQNFLMRYALERLLYRLSLWDMLHPGRKFAEKLADGDVTVKSLTTRLSDFFKGKPVPLIQERDEDAD
jgi:hypothetical protein